MLKNQFNTLFDLLAVLAGILLPFAFAPFYLFFLAPIATALLLLTWKNVSPRRCFWRGLLFGISSFGVGVSWVFISIHRFGGTNIVIASIITLLFILTLSLFPAIQGYCLSRFFSYKRTTTYLCVFPASWVLFEWFREWFLTGFPWLFLGFSQTNSPLRGYAPILGSYAVTFAVALSAALLVLMITNRHNIKRVTLFLGVLIVIWLVGGLLSSIQWTHPVGKPLQVSLIQGNIPQQIKWNPDQILPTMQKYENLTQKNWHSQLIIWPEGAIPLPIPDANSFLEKLSKKAKEHHSTIITGIPIEAYKTGKIYNGAIALGNGHGVYLKRHLVPFGEYVPFEKLLRGLIGFFDLPMSDFSPGAISQPLLTMGNTKIALYICYEIAYSNLVRSDLPAAQLLITISDDAWFGESIAAAQHVQMAQMRAIESGRYCLFSTNNGLTAIIQPNGRILKTLPRFQASALTAKIKRMTGTTPWIRFGHWPVLIFSLLCLLT